MTQNLVLGAWKEERVMKVERPGLATLALAAVLASGVAGGDVINCTGTATPFQITLNCNTGECDVVLRR